MACGGFSYGDTLGAGEGWARSVLFNQRLTEQFRGFFHRERHLRARHLQRLPDVRGAGRPRSPAPRRGRASPATGREQYEARLTLVEVLESPSILFAGMAGSRMPIAVAHGEGFADFSARGDSGAVQRAMRFVDHHGAPAEAYPHNPNGSPDGLTAVTTADGRFTAMMPHPERVFRNVQMCWTSGADRGREPVAADVPQRAGLGGLSRGSGPADLTLLGRVTPTHQLHGNHRDPHSDDGHPHARLADAPDEHRGGDEQDGGNDPHHD